MSTTASARDRFVAANSKSMTLAVVLAIFLGPLGAIYGSAIGGVILVLATIATGAVGLIVTWPLAIVVAMIGVGRARARAEAEADLRAGR